MKSSSEMNGSLKLNLLKMFVHYLHYDYIYCVHYNYNYIGAIAERTHAFYGKGSGPIWFDDLICLGSESSLFQCQGFIPHNCRHFEDSGVICTPNCTNGDIRLVNGTNHSEGRVEICLNNGWGTICDSSWTEADASVVCNQLQMPSECKTTTHNNEMYDYNYNDTYSADCLNFV